MEHGGNRQLLCVICSCPSSLPQTQPRPTAAALITHNTNTGTPESFRRGEEEGGGGGVDSRNTDERVKRQRYTSVALIHLFPYEPLQSFPFSCYRFETKFHVWGSENGLIYSNCSRWCQILCRPESPYCDSLVLKQINHVNCSTAAVIMSFGERQWKRSRSGATSPELN